MEVFVEQPLALPGCAKYEDGLLVLQLLELFKWYKCLLSTLFRKDSISVMDGQKDGGEVVERQSLVN